MNNEEKYKVIDDENIYICLDDDDVNVNDIDILTAFKSSFKPVKPAPIITVIDDDSDDGISSSSSSSTKKERRIFINDENPNPGLLAQPFVCDMCTISKPKHQSMIIKGCTHFYCCQCIENYVSSKLGDGTTDISCPVPDCWGTLDPEYCKDFLSKEIYCRWGKQFSESAIMSEQKCYCPFVDCGALMVDDTGERVTRAVCPYCHRMFCAMCRVVWHEGITCEQRQKL